MDTDKTVTAIFSQLGQTYIPDDNFEAYLETNGMGNGVDGDDYVTTNNIVGVTNLNVSGLNIADLTGIRFFTALQNLNCSNNQLTGLDVSNNTALIWLDCSDNQLISLDIRNGNNTAFTFFNAINNPDLSCIFVDDPVWATANWTNIDGTVHFVANQAECDSLDFVDIVLKSSLKIYPNPVKNQLNIQSEINREMQIELYSLTGQSLLHKDTVNGRCTVDLTTLPTAMYIIKINIRGESVYYYVIKE